MKQVINIGTRERERDNRLRGTRNQIIPDEMEIEAPISWSRRPRCRMETIDQSEPMFRLTTARPKNPNKRSYSPSPIKKQSSEGKIGSYSKISRSNSRHLLWHLCGMLSLFIYIRSQPQD